MVAWGNQEFGGDCSKVHAQLIDVHIYASNETFAALKADGSVVSWGSNTGQAEALARRQ